MSEPVQDMRGALAPNFLTKKQEAIAIATVSVASGLYILKSLPALFLPQGVFALLISLFLGLIFGLILAGCAFFYLFYRFTHPEPPRSIPLPGTTPSLIAADSISGTAGGGGGRYTRTRDVTRPGPTMPHAYTSRGELHGVIFTVTQPHWDRTSCVLDWPPATTGFKMWHAALSQGTLVLTPLPRHHHHTHPQHGNTKGNGKKKNKRKQGEQEESEHQNEKIPQGVETAATTTVAIEPESQQIQKVGIPLEGCTIELVRDALQGRSEMVRRAPLLLSHGSWPLLDGEKKVYIFATDPAAKQEWLHALSYWCVYTSGYDESCWEGSVKSIEETYQVFCRVMAEKSTLPFVQEKMNSLNATGDGGAVVTRGVNSDSAEAVPSSLARRSIDLLSGGGGGTRGEDGKLGKRASWKRWRLSRREGQDGGDIQAHDEKEGEQVGAINDMAGDTTPTTVDGAVAAFDTTAASKATAAADNEVELRSPVEVEHVATAEEIDSIIEMRWMQSRKVPVPPAPPKQKQERKGGSGRGGGISNAPSAASSLAPSPSLSPVKVPPIGAVVYRQVNLPQQPHSGAAPAGGPSSSSVTANTTLPGSLQASPTKTQRQQRGQQHPSSSAHPQALSPRSQAAQASRLPPNFPSPLLPFDFFINATATRACFDLIRNPAFSEHVRARIQRQLSRMHTPDYVTSLEVVSVNTGCTAPTLAKFAAVPQPAAHAAFPQLIFDMKYSGSFTVTIECKVDIRDAAAWSAIDHAIDRLEGKKKKKKTNAEIVGMHEEGIRDDERDLFDGSTSSGDEEEDRYEDEGDEEEELIPPSGSSDDTSTSPSISGSPKSNDNQTTQQKHENKQTKRRLLGHLRQKTAQKLRKLADSTATRISNMPLRVSLTFSVLEGTMCIWIPPPPGDRLFWSFLAPPKLSLKATPQIGQRLIKYAYHASRASAWIQARLELAFKKNLVFPCGGDIALPLLLPLWNPRAFDVLEGLDKEKEQAGVAGQRSRAVNNSSSNRPPVQVTRLEEREENGAVSNSGAVGSIAPAPFVEFQLRRPGNNANAI